MNVTPARSMTTGPESSARLAAASTRGPPAMSISPDTMIAPSGPTSMVTVSLLAGSVVIDARSRGRSVVRSAGPRGRTSGGCPSSDPGIRRGPHSLRSADPAARHAHRRRQRRGQGHTRGCDGQQDREAPREAEGAICDVRLDGDDGGNDAGERAQEQDHAALTGERREEQPEPESDEDDPADRRSRGTENLDDRFLQRVVEAGFATITPPTTSIAIESAPAAIAGNDTVRRVCTSCTSRSTVAVGATTMRSSATGG